MSEITAIKTTKFFNNANAIITLDTTRKELLNTLVDQIVIERKKNNKVSLNFICTHNSRRSQLAQVWAHYAIRYFKLKRIKSYSGGTEITAMHRNTVKTLQNVGFKFKLLEFSHENPVYEISFKKMKKPIVSFSKLHDDTINKKPFIAITTCASAEENCPFIPDALARIHLPYIDPKSSDDTPEMQTKYLETNQQIAAELFYVFQQVKSLH